MASTGVFLRRAQLILLKTDLKLEITLSDSEHFSVESELLCTAQHFVKPSHVLRGVLIFPLLMGHDSRNSGGEGEHRLAEAGLVLIGSPSRSHPVCSLGVVPLNEALL